MAEFQEVIRQFNRMCDTCNNCECGLYNVGSFESCCGKLVSLPAESEKEIMAWAAEHPEPVYPTWAQYFNKIRINNGCKPLLTDAELLKVVCMPIPADIAQKLELQPKEG